MPEVRFGLDRLLAGEASGSVPKTARIGLITNDTARLAGDASVLARAALRDAGFNLVRLFGPEHGIAASAADGAAVGDSVDPVTKLPVVSLYGQSHRPSPEHLRDLDVVLFDIPDVGARFYTYIWTLSYVLEACAGTGKPLVVLDRPNPIGGELDACEGPMLDEAQFSTFVGRWNVPIRHGLTVGELATLWNAERTLGCELRVVTSQGWRRSMHWPDTGLPFVATSPAMPSYQTALVYPGTCLIEGTNLSEGRGTDEPFRLVGAPWVDADAVAEQFNSLRLPGFHAQPAEFTPGGRKYAGEPCRGTRLVVTDPRAARSVAAGLNLVAIVRRLHRHRMTFDPNAGGHFDRLLGTRAPRESLEADPNVTREQVGRWTSTDGWSRRAAPHLLYE